MIVALGELWSPRTDGGVFVQVVVTIMLIGVLAWTARREGSVVLLIVGVGTVVLAWYGIRALH
ncbi:MAG: hypothetical protein HKN44_10985 [Ilumatobacter sp.]|nr:hypothetical protein [Ilumatobacter sp.]